MLSIHTQKGGKGHHIERYIQSSERYMLENLSHSVSVKDLLQRLSISESSLNQFFKDYKGMAPMKYFNLLKMKKAKILLKASNMPIKEIAHHLGFEDALYFSRAFRNHYRRSPSDFRKGNV